MSWEADRERERERKRQRGCEGRGTVNRGAEPGKRRMVQESSRDERREDTGGNAIKEKRSGKDTCDQGGRGGVRPQAKACRSLAGMKRVSQV